ncbi:MAG: sensor histidine kinase, partial [Candidatus Methylomirabilia bacterium]
NTLNAIAALIPEEPERAERLVERLSELLRFSLDLSGRGTVALEKELEIVEAYLEIQGARLGERLRYRIEVPEALWPMPVPPLALHTLVENSVTHVAAERREGAEVRVTGKLLDGRPVLEVWDDGPGFRLDRIPPGRGLDTLRTRLAALFGARAGLEVARRNGGTSVALSLPPEGAP